MRALALAVCLFACGCGSTTDGPRPKTYGGSRPADLHAPQPLTAGKQYPLVVILHGLGVNGFTQFAVFGAQKLIDADEALVIAPDGTPNSQNIAFWNADPACCDYEHQNPDDVAYIGGLIDDISADWPVDKHQVYVLGHSNGGYMAYRMACERADVIAAIGSLAGNAATTAADCHPSHPVSVLHMHGTADTTVPFDASPGAAYDVAQWAAHDGCGTARTPTVTLDLDTSVPGAETHGETTSGCPSGTAVDLWTMQGSSHIPIYDSMAIDSIFGWLTDHHR